MELRLAQVLTGPGTLDHAAFASIITALKDEPQATMSWLEQPAKRRTLAKIGQVVRTHDRLTHEALDSLPQSRQIRWIRQILVHGHALQWRDERLHEIQRWIENISTTICEPADRRTLQAFARWHGMRRLRAAAARAPLTLAQILTVRRAIGSAVKFIAHLHGISSALRRVTQAELDAWLAAGSASRCHVRHLLNWAGSHGHAPRLILPTDQLRGARIPADHRQLIATTRRLLGGGDVPLQDRVAGLLVVLYGQPAARICRIRIDHVTTIDGQVYLRLGVHPLALPPNVGTLVTQLIHDRRGHHAIGRTTDHPWLFPGMPGAHLSPQAMGNRLRLLEITPRTHRNAALLHLAAELPAAVVAKLLGLSNSAATIWATHAGNTRSRYAGAVATRMARRQ